MLLFTNAIVPDRNGGLERYCRELAGALSAKGTDVVLHARKVNAHDRERCVEADGVEVRRFNTPARESSTYALGYPISAMRAARAAVREASGARLLHSNFPLDGMALALGRTPYVHTFHAPVHRELVPEHQDRYALPRASYGLVTRLARAYESLVVRRASRVVVLSEFMRAQAIALGAPAERITLIAGGVDTERFSSGAPVDHPWAAANGALMFSARRMVPRTGVGELVEAFALIARELPDARLALAGSGPLEHQIRARVHELGLEERVAILGWISDAELVGWYRAADLVIMPTQELEGFGLTSAEAMACGTPVVGTPAGANPEVLSRLDDSLIATDASPAAIASTALKLLRERERLRRLAAAARAAIHPQLGWSAVADRHLELYERQRTAA